MGAAGRKPDQRVAGVDRIAKDDLVGNNGADRRAAEVKAVRRRVAADQLRQHRNLAPRYFDSGLLGADFEPFANPCQGGWVGLLYGQVIEHRDRLSADADDVVDVHRDAVDPDRLEPVGLLGKDELRADAVGRHR